MQKGDIHHCPYNLTSSSSPCSGSPALLISMALAPARLTSSKQLVDLPTGFPIIKFAMTNKVPISAVTSKPIINQMGGPITNMKSYTRATKRLDLREGRVNNLDFTSEEVDIVTRKVKQTGKVTAV